MNITNIEVTLERTDREALQGCVSCQSCYPPHSGAVGKEETLS